MYWQQIIVGIILLVAVVLSVIRVVRFLTNPLRKCKGCSQACGGCSLEELKHTIEKKKKSKLV